MSSEPTPRKKPDAGSYALAYISEKVNMESDSMYFVEFYDPHSHSFIMRSVDGKYFVVQVNEIDGALLKGESHNVR